MDSNIRQLYDQSVVDRVFIVTGGAALLGSGVVEKSYRDRISTPMRFKTFEEENQTALRDFLIDSIDSEETPFINADAPKLPEGSNWKNNDYLGLDLAIVLRGLGWNIRTYSMLSDTAVKDYREKDKIKVVRSIFQSEIETAKSALVVPSMRRETSTGFMDTKFDVARLALANNVEQCTISDGERTTLHGLITRNALATYFLPDKQRSDGAIAA